MEVYDQAEFTGAAPKDFVLVKLDFPESAELKAKVPNPARNQELAEKYGVQGFPTVLVMTAEGEVYGRTGYQPGGAAKWMESLKQTRETGRPALFEAIALAKVFADAKGDARTEVVGKAVAMLEKAADGAAWADPVVPAARAALEVDADNAKGLKLRAVKAFLQRGSTEPAILGAVTALDPKNEQGLLEQAVMAQVSSVRDEASLKAAAKAIEDLDAAGAIRDAERKQIFYANVAFWNFRVLNDQEKAKAWARKLKAVADPKNERLTQLLEAILGKDEAPKEAEPPKDAPAEEPSKDAAK